MKHAMNRANRQAADQASPARPRLQALDAFRGLTIAAMILVNNPGNWSYVYPPLRHADWHGCTPTDLIFPFFLFIVGVAMAYALPRHLDAGRPGRSFWWRVLRRSAILIALGLLLNAVMPIAQAIRSSDIAPLTTIRLPGVLQRIGLVYLLACAVAVYLKPRTQVIVSAVILIGVPLLMLAYRPGDPFDAESNLARAIDRLLFPNAMLYSGSATDPEGLLGTLPALVTTLIGYWVGGAVRARARMDVRFVLRLGAWGVAMAALGWAAAFLVPLNKALWSSSYVLFTAGWACVGLAGCLAWCDLARLPGRSALALIGRHAITVFVGSGLMARALLLLPSPMPGVPMKPWLFIQTLEFGLAGTDASLLLAVVMVLVWSGIALAMDRLGLVFKV